MEGLIIIIIKVLGPQLLATMHQAGTSAIQPKSTGTLSRLSAGRHHRLTYGWEMQAAWLAQFPQLKYLCDHVTEIC